MASEMRVSGADLNARPVTRPGEVLEATPGLVVTQHKRGRQGEPVFLRGYNHDHGTDLAIFVDDIVQFADPPPAAVCQNGVADRILHPVEPLAARSP